MSVCADHLLITPKYISFPRCDKRQDYLDISVSAFPPAKFHTHYLFFIFGHAKSLGSAKLLGGVTQTTVWGLSSTEETSQITNLRDPYGVVCRDPPARQGRQGCKMACLSRLSRCPLRLGGRAVRQSLLKNEEHPLAGGTPLIRPPPLATRCTE